MSCNYWSELAHDFEDILENDDQYDVIIMAGEYPEDVEFRAHSLVLRARCSYFKQAFQHNWSEKTEFDSFIFKKPNISAKVFQVILRYLYTGIINYDQHEPVILVRCLIAADELGLLKLIEHIEGHLCRKPDILKKNIVSILEIIHKTDSVKGLTDRCLEIISGSTELLLSSERFPKLEKSIITMVLQREDLHLRDSEVWDFLVRWVSAHYLIDQKDSTWSWEERHNQAKQAIREHIPFIGFYDMPKTDFYSKVLPYRDLLPPDLVTSVFQHHENPHSEVPLSYRPSRIRKPNSVLLQSDAFELFAKWINLTGGTMHNASYRFQLLLRGSRDGFSASAFHRCCDHKGATIVVTKSKNCDLLVGGYNPLSWTSSNQWLKTSDSFLFRLNANDLISAKLGLVKKNYAHQAIHDHHDLGPCFGRGPDFLLHGSKSCSSHSRANLTNLGLPTTILEYNVETSNPSAKATMPTGIFGFGVPGPLPIANDAASFTLPEFFAVRECEIFQVIKLAN